MGFHPLLKGGKEEPAVLSACMTACPTFCLVHTSTSKSMKGINMKLHR